MGSQLSKKFMDSVKLYVPNLQIHRCLTLAMLLLLPSASFAASDAVCAVVKIEIKQELTLERQAFDAVMKITNGLDTVSIDNVNINVTFQDENGAAVLATSDTTSTTAKFFITLDRMTNISAVNGTDSIAPKSTAEIHWLIVPAPGASNGLPSGTLYFVGASLDYNLGGEPQNVTVTPDFIYVKPMPLLTLDYFLTKDVVADDPFTLEIEPPETFYLGVRVTNNGQGVAKSVKIDSAQPKIVENKQGLLINFLITGSSIDDQPSTPSLLVNLGDIPGNGAKVGRWDMETTLAGTFTEFTAAFSHADEYGGTLTSLIDAVNTHFLVRNVIVDAPGRDLIRDFLALDANTLRVYESDGADTTVIDQSTTATFVPFGSAGIDAIYTLTIPVTPGLVYVKLNDPFGGANVMKEVVRSDGKYIPLANAWFSKIKNRTTNAWEYSVNFFDTGTTGTYSVRMGPAVYGPTAPSVQFIPNRTTYEGNQIGFILEASDVNGDNITWTASSLPNGSTFTDNTGGQATFNWTPSIGQAGLYTIKYRATDATGLFTEKVATIQVNPANDIDGDGMDDAWEIANFGDLSRNGTGDFDGDGISDLDEFLNNSNPNLDPPAAPADLALLPGNGQATASWPVVSGATSYNIYWGLSAGVSKDTGTLISNVTSAYIHSGLVNDTTYYYIVTSMGLGGESVASIEASAKVGIKQWGTAVLQETNDLGDATNTVVAMNGNGDVVTVRLQSNGTEEHVVANIYTAGANWTADIAIETNTGNASNPAVAMDSNQNIIILWQQEDAGVQSIWQSRYDSTAQTWSVPLPLESDAINAASKPSIVMDAGGRAMAAWIQSDGTVVAGSQLLNTVHAVAYIPESGWLSEARIESDSVTSIIDVQTIMDVLGNAIVTWTNTNDNLSYNLQSNRYLAGTGWNLNPTLIRGTITTDNTAAVTFNLTGDATGNAIVVWAQNDGVRNNIWASHFAVATGWTPTVSAIETNNVGGAYAPVVTMDSAGNAAAAWQHSDGTVNSVWVSLYTSLGGWVTTTTPIETDDTASTSNAKILLSADGSVIVAWQQSDGTNENIWSNTYDAFDSKWRSALIIDNENLGDATNVDLGINFNGDAIAFWQQANATRINAWINTYNATNAGTPNSPPVITTNGDQAVNAGDTVTLNATGTLDQDGSIASYSWTQTSGTAVVINNNATVTAGFIAPVVSVAETLVFNLAVADDLGAISNATINITVNPVNGLPSVVVGTAQTVNEQAVVSLSGSATDSDGSIVSLVWSQLSGTTVTLTDDGSGAANFTAPVLATTEILTFRLTATDNTGSIASADIAVTVNPVNTLPLVNAGSAQNVIEQTLVNLNGSATDTDGLIVSLVWSQVTGSSVILTDNADGTASFTSPAVTSNQLLTFRLTATDNEGGVATSDVNINVTMPNIAPTVNAGNNQIVDEQTTVNLSGSATDTDGTITDMVWSQVSGSVVAIIDSGNGNASFTSPTLVVAEVLTFRLTVTDNNGTSVSADVAITVNPVNSAPSVSAGSAQTVNEQTTVTLNGTASDIDGTIASLVWSQISGATVVLSDNGSGVASFTAQTLLATEIFTFRLTATDNEGAIASSDVNVTVNEVADTTPPTQVTGVAGTPTADSIALSWSASSDTDSGVTAYRIYRDAGTTPLVEVTGLSYTDTALLENKEYRYEITAVDAAGNESIRSTSLAVTTLSSSIAPVQLDNNDSGFRASRGWSSSVSPTGYFGSNFLFAKRIRGESLSGRGNRAVRWSMTVPNPAQYDLQVYVYGDSTMNNQALYTITHDGGTVQTKVNIQVGSWQWVTVGTYSFTQGTATVILTVAGNGTVVADAVRLVPKTADTTAPTTPTNLAITTTAFEAALTWDASTDAESGIASYSIYRNDSGASTSIGSTTGLTFSDVSVFENTTYTYQVSAVDVSGNESISSTSVTITTPLNVDITAPGQVTGISTSSTADSITLSWIASSDTDSGVSLYRIYRDGSPIPLTEVTSLSYTDTGLAATAVYSYVVTAVDAAGNESIISVAVTPSTL